MGEKLFSNHYWYTDGLNLYAYGKNNPVRYTDPSGHNVTSGPDRENDVPDDTDSFYEDMYDNQRETIPEYEDYLDAIREAQAEAATDAQMSTKPDEVMSSESGRETELFLPDEYYQKLNKDIHKGYQTPNTKEVYRRLGNTSNEIETSVVISDEFGRIKYRIDYSTHGRDLAHTNPHIHEFVGSTGKGDYHISELRYFVDESTGKMRLGKANNDGTYRWLDMED